MGWIKRWGRIEEEKWKYSPNLTHKTTDKVHAEVPFPGNHFGYHVITWFIRLSFIFQSLGIGLLIVVEESYPAGQKNLREVSYKLMMTGTSLSSQWPGVDAHDSSDPIYLPFPAGIMQQDNSEQVIINPRLIARHYIGTWFFLDLISSIPLDYIFLIFNSIRGSDVSWGKSWNLEGEYWTWPSISRTFLHLRYLVSWQQPHGIKRLGGSAGRKPWKVESWLPICVESWGGCQRTTVCGGNLFWRFCSMFFESSTCLVGQHGSSSELNGLGNSLKTCSKTLGTSGSA